MSATLRRAAMASEEVAIVLERLGLEMEVARETESAGREETVDSYTVLKHGSLPWVDGGGGEVLRT